MSTNTDVNKMVQREVRLKSRPDGTPTESNFELVETTLPVPADGEILVRNQWMSVDPYMRGRMRDVESYVDPFAIGKVMEGSCIGEVVESKSEDFKVGDKVLGFKGWRDFWCSSGEGVTKVDPNLAPIQSYLSVLGITGLTAYADLFKIGELQGGETVFVSAASGAVGSIVCQIAKIKNCKVLGSAGSAAKINWLKQKAGVDDAFNYHDTDDVSARLKELCPQGVDVYFDNVGGDHLQGAIGNMNDFGRIVCCGAISTYNEKEPLPGPNNFFKIISKRLRMQGFIVSDHLDLQEEFARKMAGWIDEGHVTWEETITEGLENAGEAFLKLFSGEKMGKSLVKI